MEDKRTDAGQYYPGGKVIRTQPTDKGDVRHSEFADLDPETTSLAVVIERLKGA